MDSALSFLGVAVSIIVSIVGATWTLHRRLATNEVKAVEQNGATREKVAEVKGALDVVAAKLEAHTEADAQNFAELKQQVRNGPRRAR